jgi:hypothetical protein
MRILCCGVACAVHADDMAIAIDSYSLRERIAIQA